MLAPTEPPPIITTSASAWTESGALLSSVYFVIDTIEKTPLPFEMENPRNI